jgi:hypothetical protein
MFSLENILIFFINKVHLPQPLLIRGGEFKSFRHICYNKKVKFLFQKKTWTVLLLVSFYLLLIYIWRTSNFGFDKLGDNLENNFSGFWGMCRSGNFTSELVKRERGDAEMVDYNNQINQLMMSQIDLPAVGAFTKEYALEEHDAGVLKMQQCLNKLGFLIAKNGAGSVGQETDKYGLGTADALKRFQKHNNLICKFGVPDLVTREALNKACGQGR